MNQSNTHALRFTGSQQRGFTLIELMIAITVALFLIAGLLKMVQSTKNTFVVQNQLAQLQDNERLVMTFMAEVVESAGYFPQPNIYSNTAVLPVAGVFATAGQAVFGQYSAAAAGDNMTIRYAAGLNDNVFNCRGIKNTTVPTYDTFVNKFWIDNTAVNNPANVANPVLTCTFSSNVTAATNVPLVNGVKTMSIFYGVKRNPADTGSCADTYLRGDQMAAADWSQVCSVKVTVSFINPLNPAAVIPVTRVIAVMNNAGVDS